MDTPVSPPLRLARAALLGAVVMACGAVAHASAEGLLPGIGGMVTLYVIAVAGCALFLGREASALRLVALTVVGQTVVHTAFSAMAGHRGADPGREQVATPRHGADLVPPSSPAELPDRALMDVHDHLLQGAPRPPAVDPEVPGWLVHGVADLAAHPWMALTHVVAAALVGLWLAVGERALWSLLALARTTVHAVVRAALCAVGCAQQLVLLETVRVVPAPADCLLARPVLPVWSRGPVRRGPPAGSLTR